MSSCVAVQQLVRFFRLMGGLLVNQKALFIGLSKSISALRLEPKEHGNGAKMGLFSQLGPGTELVVCGEGFNERTVKVRANGVCYFVFSQDIESSKAKA